MSKKQKRSIEEYYLKSMSKEFLKKSRLSIDRLYNVKDLVGPSVGERILDLGCGIGTFTVEYSSFSKHIVGLDFSPKALKTTKHFVRLFGNDKKVELVCADVQHIPFCSECFDKLICADVVEHLFPVEYEKMLFESRRVLKKSGELIVYTPNPSHIFELLRRKNFILKKDWSHVDLKQLPYLLTTLNNAGFTVVKAYFKESHVPIFNAIEKIFMKFPYVAPLFQRRICILAKHTEGDA